MKRTAPQFAINEDTESCIEFTERGQFSYTQIYNGRPKADRIEEVGENTGEKRWRYYFSCSQDQLFRYLLRFNIGEARILDPDELRLKLLSYYQKAVKFCRS